MPRSHLCSVALCTEAESRGPMWLLLLHRGAGVREPLQKARLPVENQSGDTGGKKQLMGGFPRQELQLPTRPSSRRACALSNLCLWPAPRHTVRPPRTYGGPSPQVLVLTFTHLPFETDHCATRSKSPPPGCTASVAEAVSERRAGW